MDRYNQEKGKASKHEQTKEKEKPQAKKKHTGLKVFLLIVLLAIIGAGGTGMYMYNEALNSLGVSFKEENPELEVGKHAKSMDFVRAYEGDITPAEENLNTIDVGEGSMTYTVSKELFWGYVKPERQFTLKYKVVDNEAPIILWNGSGSVVQRGTEFDINKYFGYGDNADPKPTLTVDGEVNMQQNGKYPLKLTVADASGNETKADMTIEVADSVPTAQYNPRLTSFEDFVRVNNGNDKSFGIDVSTWQGDIDFDKVKSAGCDFVIIRIGYSVDGNVEMDSKFEQNYKNAKAAGLKVGIYLYSYDNTEEEVRKSADWVAEKLGGDKLDLPVAFDWEDFGEFQLFEMSFAQLNSYYDAFADELKGKGYDTMLYGSKNFLEKVWKETSTRPVWLAHYTERTDYSKPYMIWQASQTGKIDGIDGAVDMDILFE